MATDKKGSEKDEGKTSLVNKSCSATYDSINTIVIKSTPFRHLILILFFITSALNNFSVAYSFVTDSFVNFYNTDLVMTSLMLNCVMFGFIIAVLPAVIIFESKGLRCGVLIGVFSTAFGSVLLCASVHPTRFWVVMVAQFVIGIGQPFNSIVPTYLSSVWYPAEQVSRACAFASLSSTFGTIAGGAILPLLINGKDLATLHQQFFRLQFSFAVISTIFFILIVLVFKDQPKYAPSKARSEILRSPVKLDLKNIFTLLMKNSNFLIHFVSFALMVGFTNTILAVLIPMLLGEYKSEESHFWIIGILITLSGMGSTIAAGYILDKIKNYKYTAFGSILACVFVVFLFAATFHLGMPTIYATTTLIGAVSAYYPIGLELNAEITYPNPEVVSTSLILTVGYIFSILFTSMGMWLTASYGEVYTNAMFMAITITALLLSGFVKPEYCRLEANKRTESALDSKPLNTKENIGP